MDKKKFIGKSVLLKNCEPIFKKFGGDKSENAFTDKPSFAIKVTPDIQSQFLEKLGVTPFEILKIKEHTPKADPSAKFDYLHISVSQNFAPEGFYMIEGTGKKVPFTLENISQLDYKRISKMYATIKICEYKNVVYAKLVGMNVIVAASLLEEAEDEFFGDAVTVSPDDDDFEEIDVPF